MKGSDADGTVIEVNLSTVKVQNFDNTITTIPTMPKNPTRANAAKDNSTMLIRNESNRANRQTISHQSKDKSSSSQDL